MSIPSRVIQLLYFVYAALLFLMMMIPVAVFALLVSTLGVLRGGNLIYKACRLWGKIWFPLVGIFHENINEQPLVDEGRKPYIYILNHISWLDAALLFKVFSRPLRPLGRAETGKVPVFGFIYRNTIVSVDRKNIRARQRSVQRMKSVLRKGISVLVFPEGTFNETGRPLAPFFDGAFRIAIETSTPLKPVLFLDTYARMPYHTAFSLNPGRCRAVFLPEISVAGLVADDIPALREQAYQQMSEALLKYEADWIREA
jgi:1-acyl-sn-glycerol-3-phosphate acyltransferase